MTENNHDVPVRDLEKNSPSIIFRRMAFWQCMGSALAVIGVISIAIGLILILLPLVANGIFLGGVVFLDLLDKILSILGIHH